MITTPLTSETVCLTPGAIYQMGITSRYVAIIVDFPCEIDLIEDDAKLLETCLHNAVELVLAKWWSRDEWDLGERETRKARILLKLM